VNPERCVGHGRCYTLAPEVFQADLDGYGSAVRPDLPSDLADQARRGRDNCPERAITLAE
jgi:ferredoxin